MCAHRGDLAPECYTTVNGTWGAPSTVASVQALAVTEAYPIAPNAFGVVLIRAAGVRGAESFCVEFDSVDGDINATLVSGAASASRTSFTRCYGEQSPAQMLLPAAVAAPFNRTTASRVLRGGFDRVCATDSAGGINIGVFCWGAGGIRTTKLGAQPLLTVAGPDFDCAVSAGGAWQCAAAPNAAAGPFLGALGQIQTNAPGNLPATASTTEFVAARDFVCTASGGSLCCFGAQGAVTALANLATAGLAASGSPYSATNPLAAAAFTVAGTWTNLTAASDVMCGFLAGTGLKCVGDDSSGLLAVPSPTSGAFVSITAGHRHACALQSNGTARCWGDDTWGQVSMTPTSTPFAMLVATNGSSCGTSTSIGITCWGALAAPQYRLTSKAVSPQYWYDKGVAAVAVPGSGRITVGLNGGNDTLCRTTLNCATLAGAVAAASEPFSTILVYNATVSDPFSVPVDLWGLQIIGVADPSTGNVAPTVNISDARVAAVGLGYLVEIAAAGTTISNIVLQSDSFWVWRPSDVPTVPCRDAVRISAKWVTVHQVNLVGIVCRNALVGANWPQYVTQAPFVTTAYPNSIALDTMGERRADTRACNALFRFHFIHPSRCAASLALSACCSIRQQLRAGLHLVLIRAVHLADQAVCNPAAGVDVGVYCCPQRHAAEGDCAGWHGVHRQRVAHGSADLCDCCPIRVHPRCAVPEQRPLLEAIHDCRVVRHRPDGYGAVHHHQPRANLRCHLQRRWLDKRHDCA